MRTYDKEFHFYSEKSLAQAQLKTRGKYRLQPIARKRASACRVALIGFGTVGRAVAKILCENSGGPSTPDPHLQSQRGEEEAALGSERCYLDRRCAVSAAVGCEIVIELIGGLTPAEQIVRSALSSGKSVVTANKQLIARHGPDLLQLASSKGCQIEFGASVAGGVPVLPALRTGLCGDRLHGIAGILNGTCNYILSRIENARIPFSEALEEAQARGYAEADASEDLDGGDARAKLAILALAGLHMQVATGIDSRPNDSRDRCGRLRLRGGTGLHHPPDFAG